MFAPRAVNQLDRITSETLNAIDFPSFVSDPNKGTFNAIVNASIQQMEAFGELLANMAKTADQFMGDNISDNQARDYLAARCPGHILSGRPGEAACGAGGNVNSDAMFGFARIGGRQEVRGMLMRQ